MKPLDDSSHWMSGPMCFSSGVGVVVVEAAWLMMLLDDSDSSDNDKDRHSQAKDMLMLLDIIDDKTFIAATVLIE